MSRFYVNRTVAEWVAKIERGDAGHYDPPIDMQEIVWRELNKREAERKQIDKKRDG